MADPLLSFEHSVLRTLAPTKGRSSRWLLAVSGGVDSLVMAEVIWRWQRKLGVAMAVAHVHHGLSSDEEQNRFRDRAQAQVEKWCKEKGVEFLTNAPLRQNLRSESELRHYRLAKLREWFLMGEYERVLFAHHADDLFETRLLRVLRGSGRQGLKAMAVERKNVIRPLLHVGRAEVENYARAAKLKWCEDPSNSSVETSLRNWLRQVWLPQLDKRSPGARRSAERSLALLAGDEFTETIGPYVGLRRRALDSLPITRREDVVARYLRTMGLCGYTKNHVQEVLKRLGRSEKSLTFTFEMLGFSFQATPDFLWASRV